MITKQFYDHIHVIVITFSCESTYLNHQPITQNLLQTIRLLGEFKGRQELFREQSPQVLETLRQASIIESTESSNRLEGVTAPHDRIAELVSRKSTPKNRPEQEIAGYRDVLDHIHTNHPHMSFDVDFVQWVHHSLYKFSPIRGGQWKSTDNEITETRPDGSKMLRFRPTSAAETPEAMRRLHANFDMVWDSGEYEPLLVISAYILDFLCIHPFLDGNGRAARLLTLLLLYKSGYEVGHFISLEEKIERTKRSYYDSLWQSSQGWHEGKHSLQPWWDYFLGVILLGAYREFSDRVGAVTSVRGAKREMIVDAIGRLPYEFQYADVERSCPGVSRPTINRALAELRKSGEIQCVRPGRNALWRKT